MNVLRSSKYRPYRAGYPVLLVFAILAGCGGDERGQNTLAAPIPMTPVPELKSDGLLSSPELQRVVDLQQARDGAALIDLLGSADESIRARAAFGLASVRDPEAVEPLHALLSDPVPEVRANAAFALGYLVLPDGGSRLLEALATESDQAVRGRLLRTIGRRGSADTLVRLAAIPVGIADEADWTLALAEGARRGVRAESIRRALAERLTHPEAEIRLAAASFFGQTQTAGPWFLDAGYVRAALDDYNLDDPAGAYLAAGLARLGNVSEDRERILRWTSRSPDWRTRMAALATIGRDGPWVGDPVVTEALTGLLDDPSGNVRTMAASVLAEQLPATTEAFDQAVAWVADSSRDWRMQVPYLAVLVAGQRPDLVIGWTRRLAEEQPFATVRGMDALAAAEGTEITHLLFEFAEAPDPLVRGTAYRVLASRWHLFWEGEEVYAHYLELFRQGLRDPANLPAVWSARALSNPELGDLGVEAELLGAFLERRADGDPNILAPLVIGLGHSAEPLLRELAEGDDPLLSYTAQLTLARLNRTAQPPLAGPLSPPFREVDWTALAAAGETPRVRIRTSHGDLVIRLYPEEAPLTVQTFLEQVASGVHDGVAFHRVVPGILVQGGDYMVGDGTGRTPYGVRTEITRLPLRRGMVGMASTGHDTEGSQFFILQADHVDLTGNFTAFGWIEEGAQVLDFLQEGDRVLTVSVE